ncbi:hypothetical protein [Sodalis sp. dw_96]|uniref:hypothetical protein n=1 Tax=Sodalis sp. dw_96 TaxID=2719794 RepID=UPI001BD5F4FE|nr:hypothetical protein [Sodalis sp. dw_96]
MTVSVQQVGNRPLNSAADESAVVSLEQRVQAEMRKLEAGSAVTQDNVDESDNLELCRGLLMKQITRDMVMKKDDMWDEWKKEWF